jgi:integrase
VRISGRMLWYVLSSSTVATGLRGRPALGNSKLARWLVWIFRWIERSTLTASSSEWVISANSDPVPTTSLARARRYVLATLRMVLDSEGAQGHLVRNVARLVDMPPLRRKKLTTFTADEADEVLRAVADDRDGRAWHLALSGLRRGEIAGLLGSCRSGQGGARDS